MPNTEPRTALAPFGAFYFAYFAFVGLFSPYWGPYLAALSFPAWQIGILTSLTQINRIYAPALWGWLADRTGRQRTVLRLAGLGGIFGFAALPVSHGFWPLFIGVLIGSFFWSAALPLVEAGVMRVLHGDSGRYARLRVWGSIGFIVASVSLGYASQAWGITVLPWAVLAVMVSVALCIWRMPVANRLPQTRAEPAPIGHVLRRREVQALLGGCFLMAFAHGPYYSFYSIWVADHGVSKGMTGWLWTAGVLAEVALFWYWPLLTRRFELRVLFAVGFAVAAVRFAMIALFPALLPVLFAAQLGHAFTFASHHAAAMAYIHRFFAGPYQARGQALYIAFSFGLGGSLGGMLAGWAWSSIGGQGVFVAAAASALLGGLLVWRYLAEPSFAH
ncbi:MFS transporter [Chitinibacteraceae bacterium HSL-7]